MFPKTFKELYHHIKFWKSIINKRCSIKKLFLKNFAIFTGKHWSLFFNKNAGLQDYNFIKKRLQHRCFLDNAVKFLRTVILKNICERLLLKVFPFMLVWSFPTWTNNITSYMGVPANIFQGSGRQFARLPPKLPDLFCNW